MNQSGTRRWQIVVQQPPVCFNLRLIFPFISHVCPTCCASSGQYVQAFQTHPDNPLYSLCVGLTFFHMASQKYVAKRHALVLQVRFACRSPTFLIYNNATLMIRVRLFCQGFSFLWRYVELRGECQESMYNLGRALHQMGLTHLAIHYYQKALTMPAPKLEVSTHNTCRLTLSVYTPVF